MRKDVRRAVEVEFAPRASQPPTMEHRRNRKDIGPLILQHYTPKSLFCDTLTALEALCDSGSQNWQLSTSFGFLRVLPTSTVSPRTPRYQPNTARPCSAATTFKIHSKYMFTGLIITTDIPSYLLVPLSLLSPAARQHMSPYQER